MLKTYLLLETDGERRVLVQKLYRWLARTRAIPGTRFLQTLKKLLWRKADNLVI